MSDFNYEIETTNHYFFENFTVDGQSVQDGTPTPSNPVPVEVVRGVNLVNPANYSSGYLQIGTDALGTASGVRKESTSEYIYIKGTNNFVLQDWVTPAGQGQALWMAYQFYDGEKARIGSRESYSTGTGATTEQYGILNITVPDTAEYIRVCARMYNDGRLMLQAGSTATPYVPYSSIGLKVNDTITPIDLQGNVLASLPDGTKDVLTVDSAGHCVLEKRVQKLVVDGDSVAFFRVDVGGLGMTQGGVSINANQSGTNYSAITDRFMQTTDYNRSGILVRVTFFNLQSESIPTTLADANTWAAANPTTVYYRLATPQTIDLGYIDVSNLKDISEEIPISIISTLDPETTYSYINHPSYDVLNPYEDYNAPEYAYPPNHFGQEWETFDANNWNKTDMLDYTGQPESHAVYTVELCELMQSGTFDWKRPELDWSEAAYNTEQYERFCKYFEQRFMFREISMLPPLHWFTAFKRMMVYELMPKYKPLYAQVENGISPLGENEYYKERHVSSAYPETLLSGNSDYISSGEDREFERIKVDNAAEALEAYRNGFRSVDATLGDELEILFISMYTSYVNGF